MATPESERVMTHDELLAKLLISNETKLYETLTQWQKALYAVVELHKPRIDEAVCIHCSKTGFWIAYPCPTIQSIDKELS